MSPGYTIAAGGYRDSIPLLRFSPSTEGNAAELQVVTECPAPKSASWIERSLHHPGVLYSMTEDAKGKVFSLKRTSSEEGEKIEVTAIRDVDGAPSHIRCLRDGSGIAVANYVGGSAFFVPVEKDGRLSTTAASTPVEFGNVYEGQTLPRPDRQGSSRAHCVVEGRAGEVFVPDLGNDRVWVLHREGESDLVVAGHLQAPPGSGPRHAVVSPDLRYLYLLTEMSHTVLVYPLDAVPLSGSFDPVSPIEGFAVDVTPPHLPKHCTDVMDAAELNLVATPGGVTLYASNRYASRLATILEKHGLDPSKAAPPEGDSICVITVDEGTDGPSVNSVNHVRTSADGARGMGVSPDGKYLAVAGRYNGTFEVYAVKGKRGETLELEVKIEGVNGIADLCWVDGWE